MRTVVVVPTYDEAENIGDLLTAIRVGAPDADVLVVDDNSPDGTAELGREGRRRARADRGAAPGRRRTAWATPTGPAFAQVLADGLRGDRHPRRRLLPRPRRHPRAARRWSRTAPTSRSAPATCPAAPPRTGRRTAWRCRATATATPAGCSACGIRDATSGFRAYRAELLSRHPRTRPPESNGYAFMTELAYRASAYRADGAAR